MTLEMRGAPVAKLIREQSESELGQLEQLPHLASLLDTSADDAVAYSRQLGKACERLGVRFTEHAIGPDTPALVARLNGDLSLSAIFVHEPAPRGLRELVDPHKDPERPIPCTAQAVLEILDFYEVSLDGAEVVVIGRSKTVGRPVAELLLDRRPGPTVTVCHSGTRDIRAHTTRADIVIAAAGQPRIVDSVREGAVVIDVGTNVDADKLVGDVDWDAVAPRCRAITPVPGGVGPVTVACLVRNVVRLAPAPPQ